MDYSLYLKRINAIHPLPATLETLEYLQYCHLLHVPFENLDIYYGTPIVLDTCNFYDKIVLRRRGGYCYECNGLFYGLLQWLGFDVRMVSCRVMTGRKMGQDFDHMALIVKIGDQEWLTDVGFGDFSIKPLLLAQQGPQKDGRADYYITSYGYVDGLKYKSVSRIKPNKKRLAPVYIFREEARELADFSEMNVYQQTSPSSHFTKQVICSQLTETGRLSLVSNRLITTNGTEKKEELLYGAEATGEVLQRVFGMAGIVPGVCTR